MSTKFYQCSYCKIYFNHEGEERVEKPLNFTDYHGACDGCKEKWMADLRQRMLEETKAVFSQ